MSDGAFSLVWICFLFCNTIDGHDLHFYVQTRNNCWNCITFLLFGVMNIAPSKGQLGLRHLVLLHLKSKSTLSHLHDCLPDPLNPQHNCQADSQLYPISLPFLCLISRNHLPLSLLLVHSQGPFPSCIYQQHWTTEHMEELHCLQHDGCHITSDTIIAACFTTEAHQASYSSTFAFEYLSNI